MLYRDVHAGAALPGISDELHEVGDSAVFRVAIADDFRPVSH
jgi:hypothetical protein